MIVTTSRLPAVAPRTQAERKRGQSMVEFALVAPIFFFLVFGIIEFGLMMFDVTTTRFAAGEAARVEAQVGTQLADCSDSTALPGCAAIYGPGYLLLYAAQGCDATCRAKVPRPAPLCDADCQAIVAAHRTALGSTHLEQVNYVEVQQIAADPVTGTFSAKAGFCQRYNWDGSVYAGPLPPPPPGVACTPGYPAPARVVVVGRMDYVRVNINFTYKWLTGIFAAVAPSPTFDSKFTVRLEPQKFGP